MLKYLFDHRRDHYYGSTLAPIEIIEYGDFQCKHCATVYPEIKLLQEKMGNQLKFVFRHYPLPAVHPLALDAAIAAEAAAQQGALSFWHMHDMIFENQRHLCLSSLSKFAEEIELDTTLFEDHRAQKKLIHKVTSDFESGSKSNVTGTPTFFINGHRYNGYSDFESLYKTCKYILTFKSMNVE
jgi:protein-disulfide isomerase